MHSGSIGVSKHLLSLWTNIAKCSGTNHDLHLKVHMIDDRIKHVKVPHEVQRKPSGITDLQHWKGICYTVLWLNFTICHIASQHRAFIPYLFFKVYWKTGT